MADTTRTANAATPARTSLIALLAGILCGCSVEPPYHPPAVSLPSQYSESSSAAHLWVRGAPADTAPKGAWWAIFNDPTLDALERRIDVSNQNVAKSVALLQASREQVKLQQSGWFPAIGATTDAQRFRTSQNLVSRSLAGTTIPDFSAGVTASWEPDLFGRVKAQVDAARSQYQASAADLAAVRLSMQAQLANDYLTWRSTQEQKTTLDRTVAAYAASLGLLEGQYREGAVDRSAIDLATAQLASVRVLDRDADINQAKLIHAMATLTGSDAASLALPGATRTQMAAGNTIDATASGATQPVIPAIPAGVPSQLLQRRPDIAAAERRLAAANADIGIARSAYFPNFTLSAAAGLESTYFAPWLTASSLFWSLGPQLAGTLFDGGRRHAATAQARAQYAAAVADYRQTVLQAVQQVDDGLSTIHALSDEAQDAELAARMSESAADTERNRFNAGAVSYMDVVTTRILALNARLKQAQLVQRHLSADVALLLALGGSWSDDHAVR